MKTKKQHRIGKYPIVIDNQPSSCHYWWLSSKADRVGHKPAEDIRKFLDEKSQWRPDEKREKISRKISRANLGKYGAEQIRQKNEMQKRG